MVANIVRLRAVPEWEAELIAIFERVRTAVRQSEPGCTAYEMRRTGEPHGFVIFESYVDAAALEVHLAAPYVREAAGPLFACLDGPPETERLRPLSP